MPAHRSHPPHAVLLALSCALACGEAASTPDANPPEGGGDGGAPTGEDAGVPMDAAAVSDAGSPLLDAASAPDAGDPGAPCVPGVRPVGPVAATFTPLFDVLVVDDAIWVVWSEGRGASSEPAPIDLAVFGFDGEERARRRLTEEPVSRLDLLPLGDDVLVAWGVQLGEWAIRTQRFDRAGAPRGAPAALPAESREILAGLLAHPRRDEAWAWTVELGEAPRFHLRALHAPGDAAWPADEALGVAARALVPFEEGALFLSRRRLALGVFASAHAFPPRATPIASQPKVSDQWGYAGEPVAHGDRWAAAILEALPGSAPSAADDSFAGVLIGEPSGRIVAETVVAEERSPDDRIHHADLLLEGDTLRHFWGLWRSGDPRGARLVLNESRHDLESGRTLDQRELGALGQDEARVRDTIGPDAPIVSGWSVALGARGEDLAIAHPIFTGLESSELLLERRCAEPER